MKPPGWIRLACSGARFDFTAWVVCAAVAGNSPATSASALDAPAAESDEAAASSTIIVNGERVRSAAGTKSDTPLIETPAHYRGVPMPTPSRFDSVRLKQPLARRAEQFPAMK